MANITREYLSELYRQSRNEVRKELGVRGGFMILALKICFTSIAVGTLVALRLIPDNTPVYQIVFGIFSGDIVGLIVVWIASPFISIWNMPKIAAQRNKELKEQLDEFLPEKDIVVETYTNFYRTQVGLDIKNLDLNEDFIGVIEMTSFKIFTLDEHCEEHDFSNPIDISNSHFDIPIIQRNDHRVVCLAELLDKTKEDNKIIFLTEKKDQISIDFFIGRPEPIPEPNFIKIFFELEFEIRGNLKNRLFTDKYSTLITLRAEVLPKPENNRFGPHLTDANIEIGEVTYLHKPRQQINESPA